MKHFLIIAFTFIISTVYSQNSKFATCGFKVTHVSEKIDQARSKVIVRVTNVSNVAKYISLPDYSLNLFADTTAIMDQSFLLIDPPLNRNADLKFVKLLSGETHIYEKTISIENISMLRVIFDFIDDSKLVNRKFKIIDDYTNTYGLRYRDYEKWKYKKKLIKYVLETNQL